FLIQMHYFFVSEFMDYGNLEMVLLYQGYFEYTQVKFYSAGILLAVHYLHDQHIIHRHFNFFHF
ncbi:hypothetical protein HELRODRAFT_70857, partial [Helobdella robusta]|uniref:Protein kinase domain-containing protein n=1 Tax=Helobdella robusta TaxID=6412 RepID=T1G0D0_HELRO